MADAAPKPFHICDDCLDPLAEELDRFSSRLSHRYDLDAIHAESEVLSNYGANSRGEVRPCDPSVNPSPEELADIQRRWDELRVPPIAEHLWELLYHYDFFFCTETLRWLSGNDVAGNFSERLNRIATRFESLEEKAREILYSAESERTERNQSFEINALLEIITKKAKELPQDESVDRSGMHHEDATALPEDLQYLKKNIYDEYYSIKNEIFETSVYLKNLSSIARAAVEVKGYVGGLIQRHDHMGGAISAFAANTPPKRQGNTEPDYEGKTLVAELGYVKLFLRHEEPEINDQKVPPLNATRYQLIKNLCNAGFDGLTGTQLTPRGGSSGAVSSLKRLARKFPADKFPNGWGAVIVFPGDGGQGTGYRLADPQIVKLEKRAEVIRVLTTTAHLHRS